MRTDDAPAQNKGGRPKVFDTPDDFFAIEAARHKAGQSRNAFCQSWTYAVRLAGERGDRLHMVHGESLRTRLQKEQRKLDTIAQEAEEMGHHEGARMIREHIRRILELQTGGTFDRQSPSSAGFSTRPANAVSAPLALHYRKSHDETEAT